MRAHEHGQLVVGGKRLELTGIGKVILRLHRPMACTPKQARVTLAGDGHWYAGLICVDVPARPKKPTGLALMRAALSLRLLEADAAIPHGVEVFVAVEPVCSHIWRPQIPI